jgi:excisionase family DNA binding protein
MPDQHFPNLLTTEEAAKLLCVEVQTLAAWRCLGTVNIPVVRCGRKILYREADLLAFVEAGGCPRKTKPATPSGQ